LTRSRDFRSDTVTQPTPEMRRAMMEAEVGDDILGEDPSVRALESFSARLFAKEEALFVVSGTMGNQVAIQALTQRGDEILVGEETHIFNLEVGGISALSGVQARPLRSHKGRFDPAEVVAAIRTGGIQSAITRVLCLENTYDLNRGIPLPGEYIDEMAGIAHKHGMSVYLDGARVFNAAAALGVSVGRICGQVDALMFCLSKGLSAPVGSVLVGDSEFIGRARRVRQRLGGGMRQAGHMAAAGLVALKTMPGRLDEDHENALRLARGLSAIHPGLACPDETGTNIVRVDFNCLGRDASFMVERLLVRGIKIKPVGSTACRMTTHRGITKGDVDEAISAIRDIVS